MKFNWTTKKLSEIAYINPRESIGKGVVAKKVPMDKLQPFCRDVPEFVLEEYKGGTKFRNGDTIMARITPCLENGKIAKVSVLSNDEVGFGSTEYIVFRAIDGVSDADFLYYLICSPLVRNPAIKSMVGSSGRQRVQTDVVANLDIELPPLEEQRKIGELLKTFDDKIKLNNAINNNLEQQMQAIFNAFFLTFDLHTYSTYMETEYGRIPSNWQFKELGNANLDISDGNYSSKYPKQNEFLPSGIPFIRGTDFNGTSISQSNMLYISPEKHSELKKGHTKRGDILITTRGEIGRIAFVPDSLVDVNINSQLVRINGSNIVPRSYLACYLTSTKVQNDFKTLTSGSALQQLPIGKLKKVMFLLPDNETLEKFDSIVEPLFIQVFANNEENIRLSQLRDTLLPKLMSGELDISDIDL